MKLVRAAALVASFTMVLVALTAALSPAHAQSPAWDAPTGLGKAQYQPQDPETTTDPSATFELRSLAALVSSLPAESVPGWASFSPFVSVFAVRPAVLPGERRGASNYAVNRRPISDVR